MTRWLRTHGVEWEAATRAEVAFYGDKWIWPWLGGVRITELTTPDVRQWRTEIQGLRKAPASPYTTNKAVAILSRALNAAVDDGVLPGNPAQPLRRVKHRAKEVTPATLQQAERLRCVLGGRDRVVVGLMAYAGLRPGEVRALQWGDVTGRAIVVRRAVGGDGLVKDTKSGSVRTVPLLAPLAADLDEVRGRSGLVVDIRDWPGWARVFRRGLRDVGMAGAFHPYALRHTFASLMIAEGRVPHEVARLLGHSTPQLTLSTYGHLFDEAQLRPGEDTEAAIGRARHEASEWFIERASAVRLSGP